MLFRFSTLVLLFVLSLPQADYSQTWTPSAHIPVTQGGDTLMAAWAGGLQSAQFNRMDFDNDGKMDLLIYDRMDNHALTFRNDGSPGQSRYIYSPQWESLIPSALFEWVLTADMDGDGDMDLFTGNQTSNIVVFKNTSFPGSPATFSLFKNPLRSIYTGSSPINLYAGKTDYPSIYDSDGDGDLDVFTFEVIGSYVEWHKNLSVENGWGTDSMTFVLQSFCYGHFQEDALTCSAIIELPPCSTGMRPVSPALHAGSTLLSLDLDNNYLTDLIVGDFSCNHVYALYNQGTTSIAHFDSVQNFFPQYDTPVELEIFPACFYMDVNNDAISDLIASPNIRIGAEDKQSVWMYRNNGTESAPDFELQSASFMQNEMIETGTGAVPAFFDYEGDGDMDFLVGNQSRNSGAATLPGQLALFVNTGTATSPSFVLVDEDFLSFSSFSRNNLAPALADIDDDGDDDLWVGTSGGDIYYMQNVASAGSPANFILTSSAFENISAGTYTAPELADIDGDGDFDLLIGNAKGNISYYENTGTAIAYAFDSVTATYGGIKINDASGFPFSNGHAKPRVADFDIDGDPDLFVGTVEGEIEIFLNIRTMAPGGPAISGGTFMNRDFGVLSAPAAARIDTSLYPTVLVGGWRGGVALMRPSGPVSVQDPALSHLLEIFPNPATGSFSIRLDASHNIYSGEIYSLQGVRMLTFEFTAGEAFIDAGLLPAGMYIVRAGNAAQMVNVIR